MAELSASTGPVKLVILPQTRTGLGRRGLRAHLEAIHGPMVVSEPDVSGGFLSYVHHYTQDIAPLQGAAVLPDRDAVTVIRFPSLAALGASKANAAYRDRISPDEDNFREIEGSVALFAQEEEIVSGLHSAPFKLFLFRPSLANDAQAWGDTLRNIAQENTLQGAAVNTIKVVEGDFPFAQFDEIGLPDAGNAARLADMVVAAAQAQFGDEDFKLLLTQAVRFI